MLHQCIFRPPICAKLTCLISGDTSLTPIVRLRLSQYKPDPDCAPLSLLIISIVRPILSYLTDSQIRFSYRFTEEHSTKYNQNKSTFNLVLFSCTSSLRDRTNITRHLHMLFMLLSTCKQPHNSPLCRTTTCQEREAHPNTPFSRFRASGTKFFHISPDSYPRA